MSPLRFSIRHYRLFSTTTKPPTFATTIPASYPRTLSAAKQKLRSEQDPDKALEIYNTFSDACSSPMGSRYTQELTVKRLAKARRFSDIETLIEAHLKDSKISQENYFSTLIRSYGLAGMYDHALKLYNQMEKFATPRTSVSFNALLNAYNVCKKYDSVGKLFDEMPKKYGFLRDKISYGILIKSFCGLSLPEKAFTVLREMEKENIEVTTVTYTTILDALYKKGKVEEAEKLWGEMIGKGCTPDVAAYNVRIMHAYQKLPEDVLVVINEMIAGELKPDTISYNYLYTCYCNHGMIAEAKKVIEDFKVNGCSPNAATFRLQVFHLCKNGEFEKAFDVFKKSVEKNKIPPFGTLKILAEGLVGKSKRKEAKGLIRTGKKKFPANIDAWNKLELELGLNNEESVPKKNGSNNEESSPKKNGLNDEESSPEKKDSTPAS
ncbi:hypothetical protein ACHQM5_005066 [Ranunculus cassubicifolius]